MKIQLGEGDITTDEFNDVCDMAKEIESLRERLANCQSDLINKSEANSLLEWKLARWMNAGHYASLIGTDKYMTAAEFERKLKNIENMPREELLEFFKVVDRDRAFWALQARECFSECFALRRSRPKTGWLCESTWWHIQRQGY